MVKINKIYTKTGDSGETGLVGGDRVPKDSLKVHAYGDIDELNAAIGAVRTSAELGKEKETLKKTLARIQNELFDLGSLLACPEGKAFQGMPTITADHSKRLEEEIDAAILGLPELRSFVLPGGTIINAQLHVARTVCRRAERSVLTLHRTSAVQKEILIYLNRLSDLLFALARRESFQEGGVEYLWEPGKAN